MRILSLLFTGAIFGYSISKVLGLNDLASTLFSVIAGIGTLFTGSLVSYLITQTFLISTVSIFYFLLFRLNEAISIPTELFQISFSAIVAVGPFVIAALPGFRKRSSYFFGPALLELNAAVLFFTLVQFLKFSRPSDSTYALSQLYFGEDNAGVVDVLRKSLEMGYTSHVFKFGEFMNAIYLAVSGHLSWFGNPDETGLVAVLTHYNLTSLLMAWAPITVLVSMVLTGNVNRTSISSIQLWIATALLLLLFWPFVDYGHTSVISSGFFAITLLALTLNKVFATKSPVLFAILSIVLAAVVGGTWFPMMPFAAATVLIVVTYLAVMAYKKGNWKIAVALALSLLLTFLTQLSSAIELAIGKNSYIGLEGGTRVASDLLLIIWLATAALAIRLVSKSKDSQPPQLSSLFTFVTVALVASSAYLYISGMQANSGSPGYGANKYMVTAVALSLPVFWLVFTGRKNGQGPLAVVAFGVLLTFALLIAQPDTRNTASFLITPPTPADVQSSDSGVYLALKEALNRNPDHVLCVADYGYPAPGAEVQMDSYFCSRWAQSLVGGDAESSSWRFVPLNRVEESYLFTVLEAYRDREVIIIRFKDPGSALPVSETWWAKYVSNSWEIIDVGS